jgi:hypothetical protein
MSALATWERSRYQPGEGRALIFYAVYGEFTEGLAISQSKYRSAGLPEGFTIRKVTRENGKALPFADLEFAKVIKDKALFERVQQAPQCLAVRGDIVDQPNLNYLRDVVGLVMFALDHGGFAVCDPQRFGLYDTERWRGEVFDAAATNLSRHVTILFSEEEHAAASEELFWYHTRGLRKFGRPDLSVRDVPQEHSKAVIELCNRFIELQIQGGRVPEGQEIRMASLPPGLICHHGGDLEDPDFNNVHIEIRWPHVK